MCKDNIPFGHLDCALWIAVLNDDHVILLKERAPHLKKFQVPDSWNDYIQIVSQIRQRATRVCHGCKLSSTQAGVGSSIDAQVETDAKTRCDLCGTSLVALSPPKVARFTLPRAVLTTNQLLAHSAQASAAQRQRTQLQPLSAEGCRNDQFWRPHCRAVRWPVEICLGGTDKLPRLRLNRWRQTVSQRISRL